MRVPTGPQIRAQVDAVVERDPEARCIAIRSPARDAWPDGLTLRNRTFKLRWCESPLEVRQSLVEAEEDPANGAVLLTPLDENALGSDVVARLSRARVFRIEGWDTVRQVFQAHEVDSRLAKRPWIADVLLENAPPEGYPPVPGGFVDLDTAWKYILERTLRLEGPRPDVVALLRWTMAPDAIHRFAKLSDTARTQTTEWLADCAGPVGELVLRSVASGAGVDALPIGLLCGVVFAQVVEPHAELAAAAVRLEKFVGDQRIAGAEGRRWAEAAAWVVRNSEPSAVQPFLNRADSLLSELHLAAYAGLSDVLPSGFEARLAGFATSLGQLVASPSDQTLAELDRHARLALAHDRAGLSASRSERVQMALRLGRWLVADTPIPTNFMALARSYRAHGGFVDWARLKLLGGDDLAALSAAYAAVAEAARVKREAFNRNFAEALRAWNTDGGAGEECVPVEAVLDTVVAPVAKHECVLMLVVDGLSLSIFRELSEDLARHSWIEAIPASALASRVGIAALPTVTEVSRASLLAGRLAVGPSSFEKTAFAAHPALVGASKATAKPLLFHKGELGDATGLSQAVRDAVGDRDQRAVGVVYNAVDDHLSGSNQLHLRWTLDDLRLLRPLLHEARAAGRVLVVTADHGHMIDEKTTQCIGTEADRWRAYAGPLQAGETLVEGGRVRTSEGATRVVCAWSEAVRYSSKKNGYHGGISPQEVIVPLSVFLPPRVDLSGWKPAPPAQPDWWEGRMAPPAAPPVSQPVTPKPGKPKAGGQAELFSGTEPAGIKTNWVAELLGSGTYQQQKKLAARVAPTDEEMRRLLEALEARGGKLSKAALAQQLGIALVRVSGFVNAARRVLNVDQYSVLFLDEASGLIELNRELLGVQFQIRAR